MADRKNPLFLRVMIVVVALLLGFSLNMFQFRNPFRSVGADPASNTQFADKSRFPSRQETALPASPPAKPAMPETAASPASPGSQQTGKPAPEKTPADIPAPVPAPAPPAPADTPAPPDAPVPAPQAAADAAADKQEKPGAPVTITVEHDNSSLGLPKVTSDAAKVKAAKIGRQVATGVPGSQPESKTVAEASSPAPTVQAAPEGPASTAAQAPQPSKTAPGTQTAANGQGDRPAIALATKDAQEQPGAPQTGAPSGPASPPEKAAAQAQPAAPKGTKILEIKTQDKPGEFVLTIVTDGPVEKVTSFHAKGPARLAVDFQGSWQSALGASIPVEGELFERVRLGAHPDKLRLVIDYRDKELSAFSEQIVEKQPKGVVVRIPKAKAKP